MTDLTFSPIGQGGPARSHAADVSRLGHLVTLYGLVLVFGWIGAMKFTAYEAGAIEGLVASSPLSSWLYAIVGQRGAANLIGIVELTAASLLAVRPWSAAVGAFGAALVMGTTAVTLTFLVTAPGWEPSLGGFPALSVVPGQFLLKDVVLLGAALWILGDALRDIRATR
ncbi:MAG: DUF417 family protein [Pseudomonadota bacterium]